MSDKKASGAAWSDAEKIAYLIVLCDHGGKIDSKIADAPVPAGRSVVSCRKLLVRLKAKHKDDIEKIKAGQSLGTTTEAAGGDGESTPGRKRKDKADSASNDNEDSEASPKKKRAGRPKKPSNTVKEEEIEEEDQEED